MLLLFLPEAIIGLFKYYYTIVPEIEDDFGIVNEILTCHYDLQQGHTPAYYRDHPQDIRHRTVQSRKPPPLQTKLMRADPDSATSPSKYSDDEQAEPQSPGPKKSKKSTKRPKTNERPDSEQGGAVSPGGIVIAKNKQAKAEEVFKSKLTVNRDLLNTDIKKFLHKSKAKFNVDEVKYAMDQARIIRASESEDHETREK